jgi:hypothetical protein
MFVVAVTVAVAVSLELELELELLLVPASSIFANSIQPLSPAILFPPSQAL